MKRLVIVALGVVLVACGGNKKSDDNHSDEVVLGETSGVEACKPDMSLDDIGQMAVNYREMAMSALENSDAQSFVEVMEARQQWYDALDEESRVVVDAKDEEWRVANAERLERSYDKSLMLSPHVKPAKQNSERK